METTSKLITHVWVCLSIKRKRSLILLNLLAIFTSVVEATTIGATLPFLSILTSPEKFYNNKFVISFLEFLKIQNRNDLLLWATLTFILLIFLAGLARFLLIWFQTKLSWSISGDFAVRAYERTLYQSYTFHISKNSSEIIEGSVKARDMISSIIQPTLNIISSTIIVLAVFLVLLTIDTKTTIIAFLSILTIYYFLLKVSQGMVNKNSKIIARMQVNLTKTIQEGLGNIRDILIHKNQQTYKEIYQKTFDQFKNSCVINQIVRLTPRHVVETIGTILISLLAYILIFQDLAGSKNSSLGSNDSFLSAVPVLGALALGSQRLLPLIQQIFAGLNTIRSNSASIKDALDLINLPMTEKKNLNLLPIQFKKNICLKNVSFKYSENSNLILENINLEIPKGSKVGFVGKTGIGKSTFLDLIMGLLEPIQGNLLIDGTKINFFNSSSWQSHISHVPQDIYLADASILENITLGVPADQVDISRVYIAAKDAKISEYIENLPDKYETFIGERGIRLSGGQKQRIGIARALYKKSSVIILDEATSALDADTETSIINSIESLSKELTVLVASHRPSTLEFCDFVIVIKNGNITIKN